MSTITGLTQFMLILVPIGATLRIVLCLIYASTAEDPSHYKKKALNALIYALLAEAVTGLIQTTVLYFGGGVVF